MLTIEQVLDAIEADVNSGKIQAVVTDTTNLYSAAQQLYKDCVALVNFGNVQQVTSKTHTEEQRKAIAERIGKIEQKLSLPPGTLGKVLTLLLDNWQNILSIVQSFGGSTGTTTTAPSA